MKGTDGLVAMVNGDMAGQRDNYEPGDSGMSTTAARSEATSRFNKILARTQRQMQGAVFLGEGREALRMLKGASTLLLKAIKGNYIDVLRDYRKNVAFGRVRKPTKNQIQRKVTSTWLEASFGWSPFVKDIQDAAKAWRRLAEKEPDV
jgi:hypothetical protein